MRIVSSASARPNFVKLAAVHHACMARGIGHSIIHTGQHYDPLFSDIFFQQLHIPTPTLNLAVKGGDSAAVIAATEASMIETLRAMEKPDVLLVYGDVSGAVGAARAAKKLGIRLGHIEAGLRSFDSSMPEERHRIEIDRLADDLFVTETAGVENLQGEGCKGHVQFVGNTMIDTLIRMLPVIERTVVEMKLPEQFGIVTLHRPSNVDTKEALTSALRFIAAVSTHCPLVLPLHHRTKRSIETHELFDLLPSSVLLSKPLSYLAFLHILKRSSFIITDSGGVQEEATFLQKRCFTLRRNTERPSTIDSGSNILIDEKNTSDVDRVLAFAADPKAPTVRIPALWDGHTGERIAHYYCP